MDKRTIDILTTLLLGVIPLIVWLLALLQGVNIPAQYVSITSIILAALSQYTSNSRVQEATETVKKWVRLDYLTTILLTIWPWILYFQPQIMGQIPAAYAGAGSFIFMILSQYVAEKRAENADTPLLDDTLSMEPQ